jgi:UDP-N-acetylmuramoyl-L-alanyl-D-glutamate--2,6-diaminopimelate ligase
MRLRELLAKAHLGKIPEELADVNISAICSDSRKASPGCLFVACKGVKADGQDYITQAIANGAKVVVAEQITPRSPTGTTLFLQVADTQLFLKDILQRFYTDPSKRIRVIGVTGTNGKTTVTYLLESVLHCAGKGCGIIGTVNYRFGQRVLKAPNTTPGVVDIYHYLSEMIDAGMDYCAMEVSSHALDQGRVAGIDFRGAIFTNLTSDHLDYHLNQEEYFQAKARLFTQLAPKAFAFINRDDSFGRRLLEMTPAQKMTYGLDQHSDLWAKEIRLSLSGTTFQLITPVGKIPIRTSLIGRHNISNILGVAAASISEGIPLEAIAEGVERLTTVPGRLEPIQQGQKFFVFVDYAHTEDALKNVLGSLRKVSTAKIILVFGCGGDRDKTKRPLMGKVAGELADLSIITNDNPRSEDPQDIIAQIQKGFTRGENKIIADRKAAIEYALNIAQEGNIVLIAGKGHEDYQIFRDRTVPFDEREIVKDYLLKKTISKK